MSVAPQRWSTEAVTALVQSASSSDGIPLVRVKEAAVVAYFCASFLYYFNNLPLGHLLNLSFFVIFGVLGFGALRPVSLYRSELVGVVVLLATFVAGTVGTLVRGDAVLADLGRSVTWLLPVVLLVVLAQEQNFRYAVVCYWVCAVNVSANLLVTAMFAEFNWNLAKFELNTGPFDISSNELSFHLVTFGFMFLVLGQYPRLRVSGLLLALSTFVHLSKAHLAASAVALLAALARGRLVIWLAIVFGIIFLLRLIVDNDALEMLVIPDSLVVVFGRLRDMTLVAGQVLAGQDASVTSIAEAIGGSRFLVYSAASEIVTQSPFGLSQWKVQSALMGLDPHSNLLYLVLREGVVVLAGYIIMCVLSMYQVRQVGKANGLVFGVLCYVFIRSMLLTYDPVKIVALFIFAARAVMSMSRAPLMTVRPSGF